MTKRFTFRNNKKGFTAVEMVIYMGILSVLIAVLLRIFSAALDTSLEAEGNATQQQDGRYILSKLSYDIHQASNITTPGVGATTNTLQLAINGITNTYTISNNALVVSNINGTDFLSSYDASISALSFQRIGTISNKPAVRIQFTLQSNSTRLTHPDSGTFQTTVSTR